MYDFQALDTLPSIFRENDAELEFPLWAKRCARITYREWPKGAILVPNISPAGRYGPFSRGLARLDSRRQGAVTDIGPAKSAVTHDTRFGQ